MSRYELYLTEKAQKELSKLESKVRERILETLITLKDYGFTRRLGIKKLRGYKNIIGFR